MISLRMVFKIVGGCSLVLVILAGPFALKKYQARQHWWEDHRRFVTLPQREAVELLFLGDSLTAGWNWPDNAVIWKEQFANRYASANFGISGDGTDQILWRIRDGELNGMHPQCVVLLAGTNNIDALNTPQQIAASISEIIGEVRNQSPRSHLLVLGLLPRGQTPHYKFRQVVRSTNLALRKLADGRSVWFLDVGPSLTNTDGTIAEDVMPDFEHLSPKGYRILADALENPVKRCVSSD